MVVAAGPRAARSGSSGSCASARPASARTCSSRSAPALFTLVSAYGFREFVGGGNSIDPTRIAAQIVTGVGFLGAGAIIRQGFSVRGLTTAATLWVVAAIGMASGAGYYSAAVITTALVLFSLWPLRIIAFRVMSRYRPETDRLLVAAVRPARARRR